MGNSNNRDNNIYITCPPVASVVDISGDKSRYYAELAEQFKNEAKGYKDTAQYYAEQNSDVTLDDINTLDTTLRNLIDNKQDTGNYALESNLPTKTSDLTNDSGYITASSVGDGTITIMQDNATIGSFTANQSGNMAINIDLSGKANISNLHALKSYLDEGELLTDAEGLANVTSYKQSNAGTGTDTYTIGGNTVSVPYTLSKTGSKVVDSAYRSEVASVYSEFGYAPYYTLLEGTNYTLPQGELYGMLQSYSDGEIVYTNQTILSEVSLNGSTDLTKTVTLPDDGYNYMVYFRGSCTTTASNTKNLHITLTGNVVSGSTYCAASWACGNFATTLYGSCLLPMKAGADNLTIYRSTSMNGTATLYAVWYRRMGKNK